MTRQQHEPARATLGEHQHIVGLMIGAARLASDTRESFT